MNQQNDDQKLASKENNESVQSQRNEQSIAQNPNPRANANTKNVPFEKTADNKEGTEGVGSEITDGEAG
jgi:hypothetical protein